MLTEKHYYNNAFAISTFQNDNAKQMTENKFDIKLRPTEVAHLDTLFEFQLDKGRWILSCIYAKRPDGQNSLFDKAHKIIERPKCKQPDNFY